MAYVLAIEGANLPDADTQIERFGHEIRAATDEEYKRATWGRRPEDFAEIAELTKEPWER